MSSSSIQVVVRLRPMNDTEKKHGTLPVIKAKTQDKSVTVIKGQGSRQARSNYTFDNVFTAFSSQEEVFNSTLKSMIRDVMQGYESTVFAYGQTGTGKTHTMEGNLSSPEHYGIIPRSAMAIFESLKKPEFMSHSVVCTYLEIYNEDLGDLLADDPAISSSMPSSSTPMKDRSNRKLSTPMKERGRPSSAVSLTPMKDHSSTSHHGKKLEIMNGKSGTFCRGLTEKQVHSASDVLDLMQRAHQLRKIGETKMNKESSRSHCVFTIIINANRRLDDGSTFEFSGKLHMVDLAGSECAKTAGMEKSSGNEVARERERMNINRSLLTLGRVIKTLKEQNSSSKKSNIRIPYRDSKLTRILQESLGGRCKTLIIATLSPSVTAIEESVSTLNYAQAANGIVNKPVSSSYLSLSSSASCSIDSGSGSTEHNTVEHWQEMECRLEYMQTQVEEAKAALARKHMQQQELVERAEKAESTVVDLEKEYFEAKGEIEILQNDLLKEREEKQTISILLRQTDIALKKTNAILEATQRTEACLTSEANNILSSLEESIKDGDELHHLLTEARERDINKRNATKKFHAASVSGLEKVMNNLKYLETRSQEHTMSIETYVSSGNGHREQMFSSIFEILNDTKSQIENLTENIQSLAQEDDGIAKILSSTSCRTTQSIKQTKVLLNSTEKELHDSFHDARTKINNYSCDLNERKTDFIKSSEEVWLDFESNIATTKVKVSNMVSNVTNGLELVRDAGSQTRKDLNLLLDQIEELSKATSSSTEMHSSQRREDISSTLEKFREGKKHLQVTKSVLNDQHLLVKNEGEEQLTKLDGLNEMMTAQKAAFERGFTKQKHLQEQALNNMFKGMQQLFKDEMGRLSEYNREQQSSFNVSSDRMLSENENIGMSVRDILGQVQNTNCNILENIKSAQSNDNLLEKTVEMSNSTLEKLENLASNGHSSMKSYLESAFGHVGTLGHQENDLTCLGETLVNDNKSIEQYSHDHVLSKSRKGVTKLSEEAQSHIEYATNTIIPNINQNLQQIEVPRNDFCKKLTSNLDQVAFDVNEATRKIQPIIEEQCRNSDNIEKTVNAHSKKIEELSKSFLSENHVKEKSLISLSSRLESSTSSLVSSCTSDLLNTKTAVHTFSLDDIQSEENAPPLPAITEIEYSSNLTSTPAAESIINGLDFSVNEETNDSMSVRSEANSCQSSTGKTITQNPSPLSDTSIQSNTQTSVNACPLQEMALNKDNIDNSSLKQPGHSKKQSIRKGTKRSNSRQRKELRKRIPTTPSRGSYSKRRRERI